MQVLIFLSAKTLKPLMQLIGNHLSVRWRNCKDEGQIILSHE